MLSGNNATTEGQTLLLAILQGFAHPAKIQQ
jgi:hypothetical protein